MTQSFLNNDRCNKLIPLEGGVDKIRIVSNNVSYGPCPKLNDEVEQHLTITSCGQVCFSVYSYGDGVEPYKLSRMNNYSISHNDAERILSAIGDYFSKNYELLLVTDIGCWDMIITNTDGIEYAFNGSLCCDFDMNGIDLSDLIRDTLGMQDLFLFDGNNKPDRIEKLTIKYHRVTKIKMKQPINEDMDYCIWDYSENLIIDRTTETLEHIQNIGTGCIVSRKYYIQDGIASLLDDIYDDYLFEDITEEDSSEIPESLETKQYELGVNFQKRTQFMRSGTYYKNDLPNDWAEMMEHIFDFISFYGNGEILNPSVYLKNKRTRDDYIFCSVEFEGSGRSYYYLTDDESIEVGDVVVVPVGNHGHTLEAEVMEIEYFQENDVPFPLDKIKTVLNKCIDYDEDFSCNDNISEEISTPEVLRQWLETHTTEKDLAYAFSKANNETGSLMHELDDNEDENNEVKITTK